VAGFDFVSGRLSMSPDKILMGDPNWRQIWVRRIPANFVRVAIIRIMSGTTWSHFYDDRWVPSIVAISYGDLFTIGESGHAFVASVGGVVFIIGANHFEKCLPGLQCLY
jgi:hypothetical protein